MPSSARFSLPVTQWMAANGGTLQGGKLYFYKSGTTTPLDVYQDAAQTTALVQPVEANAGGVWPEIWLVGASYKVVLTNAADAEIWTADPVIGEPFLAVASYAEMEELVPPLEETTVFQQGAVTAGDGTAGFWRYDPTEATAVDASNDWRLRYPAGITGTDLGRLVRVQMGRVDLVSEFGFVGDYIDGGSPGVNNAAALYRLQEAMKVSRYFEGVIGPGVYRITPDMGADPNYTGLLEASSNELYAFALQGYGSRFLYTASAVAYQRMFRVDNTDRDRPGTSCCIDGVDFDLAVPAIRTGGADMLSIAGFDYVRLRNFRVLKAHNMGVTVGRGATDHTPKSVDICQFEIGTAPLDPENNSYGTIGDTGLWLVNAAERTNVSDGLITACGDDGLALPEQHSTSSADATITGVRVRMVGGAGIKTAVPGTRIADCDVSRTRGDGVNVLWLTGENPNPRPPSGTIILGTKVREVGYLEAGEIGYTVLSGTTRDGFHLRYSGRDCQIVDCTAEDVWGSGIYVAAAATQYGDEAVAGLVVRGLTARRIGQKPIPDPENPPAPEPDSAVFRKSPTSDGCVRQVSVSGLRVFDTQVPFFNWAVGDHDEGYVTWHDNEFNDCTLDPSFLAPGRPKSWYQMLEPGSGRIKQVLLTGNLYRNVTGHTQVLRAPTADLSELSVRWSDELADYAWDQSIVPMELGSTTTARVDGVRRVVYSRAAAPATELRILDARFSYRIWLQSVDPLSGAYWEGYFDQVSKTVVAGNSATGASSTGFSVIYDPSTTPYLDGKVVIETTGTTFRAEIVVDRIVSGPTSSVA